MAQDVPGHDLTRPEGARIQAMAGIDLGALGHHQGKAHGQPVYKLLGGGLSRPVRAYASILFGVTAEATGERARGAGKGYTAVKFGWEPLGQDAKTDCAYLEAIRDAVGDDIDLMIDAGLIWDAKTTLQRARLFEPYSLAWIEEPLPPDDLEGYAKVAATARCGSRRRGEGDGRSFPADGLGPDRRGPGDLTRSALAPACRSLRSRRSAAAGGQPQLHDRHQRRRVPALPRERAERLHHGVLRRALGDQPRSGEESSSPSSRATPPCPRSPASASSPTRRSSRSTWCGTDRPAGRSRGVGAALRGYGRLSFSEDAARYPGQHWAPPSTRSTWPETNAPKGPAKNSTTRATSSTVAMRSSVPSSTRRAGSTVRVARKRPVRCPRAPAS